MTDRFMGKVAVVTGAGSGIGRAVAERFAEEGAVVAVWDVNEPAATKTAGVLAERGARASGFAVDVASADSVRAAAEAMLAEFGTVDILINNAGIFDYYASFEETTEQDWDRVLNVNLKGMFLVTKALLPALLDGGGVVVNTASISAVVAGGGGIAYTASKHGVVGFTRQLAFEYGKRGIRANAVLPGAVETEMTRPILAQRDLPILDTVSAVPAGRYAQPGEIASTILFLACAEADFVHGTSFVVDGGWTVA